MLPHASYYDALASLPNPRSQEWQHIAAGLVVLRLVDDWLDTSKHSLTAYDYNAARALIATIPKGSPLKEILDNLVMAVEHAGSPHSIATVVTGIFAYADQLDHDAQFSLSEDVLENFRQRAIGLQDSALITKACLKLALNYRLARKLRLAEKFYDEGIFYAKQVGDSVGAFKGECGRAKLTGMLGNVDAAHIAFETLVHNAKKNGDTNLVSSALHDWGHLYMSTVDDGKIALPMFEEALSMCDGDAVYLAADVAAARLGVGDIRRSQETNVCLAVTAKHRRIRWQAVVNLMYGEACLGNVEQFHWYVSVLDPLTTHRYFRYLYKTVAAEGFRILGDTSKAATWHTEARHLEAGGLMNNRQDERKEHAPSTDA